MKRTAIFLSLIFLTGLSLLISEPAHALFELRATYGLNSSNPDLNKAYGGTNSIPSVAPLYGLGADAIVSLPLIPIGFGLRYENLGLKLSGNNLDFDANVTRTALLLNYRIIDTLLFVGPIATIGLSHQNHLNVKENSNDYAKFEASNMTSYSVGVEAGAKLAGLLVGGEAGYASMNMKGAKDSGPNSLSSADFDFSGFYAKVMIGFSIL